MEANCNMENPKESKKSLLHSNEHSRNKQIKLPSFEVYYIQMKQTWWKMACDITTNLMQVIGSQLHWGKPERIKEKPIQFKRT